MALAMRNYARAAMVFVVGLIVFSVASWADITVYPLALKLPIPAGEATEAGFWVENTGKAPAHVRITLHDWWRTPDGKLQILPPGALKGSCASWITYAPTSLEVPPGKRLWLTVKVAVPEGEEGDRWAMLLVAEYPPERGTTQGFGTRIVVAYVVKILRFDPANSVRAGEVRGVEVLSTQPLKLKITYANTGTAYTKNTGKVEVRDVFGETVRSFELEEFPTLPGEERVIIATDPSDEPLSPGVYYAFVTIDFGGDYLVQGGTMFQVEAPSE